MRKHLILDILCILGQTSFFKYYKSNMILNVRDGKACIHSFLLCSKKSLTNFENLLAVVDSIKTHVPNLCIILILIIPHL